MESKLFLKELTNIELKERLLKLLIEFKNFCEKNELSYYLVGGTLLGAVRHQGFIPWDDDIDVTMPRSDYNKFISIFKENNYVLYAPEIDKQYKYQFAKLCEKSSILYEQSFDCGRQLGIHIDIFPLDGLGKDYKEAKNILKKLKWYIYLSFEAMVPNYISSKKITSNFIRKILYRFAKIPSMNFFARKINKIAQSKSIEKSNYVGFITHSVLEKRIMPKSIYEHSIDINFENNKFKIMSGYNEFLERFYGADYMELPPIEKRICHNRKVYINE